MGFNEPDVSFHSNMSPLEVADPWPEVEKLAHGKQIVSPMTQMKVHVQYTPRGFPIFRKTPRKIFRAENLSVFPKSVFLGVFSIFSPRTFYRPS